MKKKLLFITLLAALFVCVFAISASAVEIYDDAPARTNITIREDDIVVFDDGYATLSAYVVKDNVKFSGPGSFDFKYIEGKTGKTYSYSNIVELDIPQGVTSIGSNSFHKNNNPAVKRVSFPNTVTSLGDCVFQECKSLEECTFEHGENDGLKAIPNWTFAHCTSLKAISFPDCIEKFTGNTQLGGCSNLTAIYLPKKLISSTGYGNTSATFGGLTKGYFVNEPFTYDNIPAKPDVYYFPAGYNSIGGEAFDSMMNLNKILVFQADGMTISDGYAFERAANGEGGLPIVVFTGDVASVSVGAWNVSAIYFANKNDVDAVSAGVSGSKTIYYCNAQGNTAHLAEPNAAKISIPATCTTNAFGASYCFCGFEMGESEIDGSALGHSYTVDLGAYYVSYMEDSYYCTGCVRCDSVENGEKAFGALFVYYGYSCTEEAIGGSYSMSQFYGVNADAVEAYTSYTGKTFEYGLVASGASNPLSCVDGNLVVADKSFTKDSKTFAHNFFGIKINGMSEKDLTTAIVFCAYVLDGDRVAYLDAGETTGTVSGTTYESVLAIIK